MAVRKIPKKSQKHDQEIANALKTYKNSDYNE